MTDRERVLALLAMYQHSPKTDLSKRRLSNHDAMAIAFFNLGQMTRKEACTLMQAWRRCKLLFTYMFNDSASGGYGFVGLHAMSRGQMMWRGGHKVGPRVPLMPGDQAYFRRHYWFRTAKKGTYAPTVECFKRMAELNFSANVHAT